MSFATTHLKSQVNEAAADSYRLAKKRVAAVARMGDRAQPEAIGVAGGATTRSTATVVTATQGVSPRNAR